MKKCKEWFCNICGRHFTTTDGFSRHIHVAHKIDSKTYYDQYIKSSEEGKCLVCKNTTTFINLGKGYNKFCCTSCSTKFQNANYTKEQINKIQKKRLHTIKETLGNDFGNRISQGLNNRTDEDKQRTKNLIRKKFYEKYNNLSEEEKQLKNKQLSDICKKWHSEKDKQFEINRKEKAKITKWNNIHKYELENNCICISTLYKEFGQGWKSLNLPIIKVGVNSYISNELVFKIEKYYNENHRTQRSKFEKEIEEFIKTFYTGKIITSDRTKIHPLELDIYLPELKLAIEFNGIYFHSSTRDTPEDYHLNKSLKCREKGIRLIHIYEFENFKEQCNLLHSLILGNDNYYKKDFNKNNLINDIPKPTIIYKDKYNNIIYGAGKLYGKEVYNGTNIHS